ncbi:MAG: FkbM family methyltransferase [Pseudomonadota bacterium]|nr:FkbM family methyltransferase [Pseudomonadota bacterium]
MNSRIKSLTKALLEKAGLELRKTRLAAGAFPAEPFNAQKEFIDRMGISQPVIFDVGAHKGETVSRYRELFPDSNIYCFEPFPDNTKILRSRFSSDPSIHVYECAISDSNGKKTFYVNDNDATSSLLPRTKDERRYFSKNADSRCTVEVDVLTIDEILQQNGIDHIDILKFDIQGGELMALRGAEKTLQRSQLSLIYTEALFVPHYEKNPLLLDLWKYLDQYDYTFFDIYNLFRAINGQLRFADTLFISKNARSQVLDRYKEEP